MDSRRPSSGGSGQSLPLAYEAQAITDIELYTYLKRLSVIARKLSAERQKKREEEELQPETTPVVELGSSKLPKNMLKALMTYFKQLALNQTNTGVESNLKRSYLAFYAQLLEMKSSQSHDFELLSQNGDLLIVKFLATVSKVAGPHLVNVQGSLFVELLRSLAKKNGGGAQLDQQLALKQQSFSDRKQSNRLSMGLNTLSAMNSSSNFSLNSLNMSQSGQNSQSVQTASQTTIRESLVTFDVGDVADHLAKVMLVSPTLFERDLQQEQAITLEGVSRAIDQCLADARSGKHIVYESKDFSSTEEYEKIVVPDMQRMEVLKQQLPPSTGFETAFPEYIPGNVRDYFSLFLQRCIESDLQAATLFSGKTKTLLQFVVQFWCVSIKTRVSCLLFAAARLYKQRAVDEQTVIKAFEYAFHLLDKETSSKPVPTNATNAGADTDASSSSSSLNSGTISDGGWPLSDKLQAQAALEELRQTVIDRICEAMGQLFNKPPKIGILIELIRNQAYYMSLRAGVPYKLKSAQLKQIKTAIQTSAEQNYDKLIESVPRNEHMEAEHIVYIMESILQTAQKLQNKYKFPLFDKLSITVVVCTVQLALFSADFMPLWEFCLSQAKQNNKEPNFETVQSLHDCFNALDDLSHQICGQSPFKFDYEEILFPYFLNWASTSGQLAHEWVKPAIQNDSNKPIDIENGIRHSSGIQDLSKSFYASLALVKEMHWQQFYYEAMLETRLVQHISESICDWASQVQQIYFANLNLDAKQEEDAWFPSKVLNAAPFEFKREEGVRLNNIVAAFTMLHEMESKLESDKVSAVIQTHERRERRLSAARKKGKTYLFTITLIGAKNLKKSDKNSQIYASLVDQDTRSQIGKTRAVPSGLICMWNDTFEVKATDSRPKLLKATVWSGNQQTNHEMLGRAIVALDPKSFTRREYGMRLLTIDLDGLPGSQLQVMVTADVEQDDIRFFFGRALRYLKRTQDSMVNAVVGQFRAFIFTVLSKQTLKEATGQIGGFDQIQKGISMLLGGKEKREETDLLDPLYDYLNTNFASLASILTAELRIEVLSKTWDVVLEALELLIIPPLDSTRTAQVQLNSAEMETVYTWLSLLRAFFYSDGAGPSLERLQSHHYQQIMAIPVYYDLQTPQLKVECDKIGKLNVRGFASSSELIARQRTVMAHRNKSVIEHQSKELNAAKRSAPRLDDVVLRILRMRGEIEFIEQYLRSRERLLQREITERQLTLF